MEHWIGYLIGFLVIIFQILIHESGHYLLARLCKLDVLEFAVGFGKPVGFTKYRKEKVITDESTKVKLIDFKNKIYFGYKYIPVKDYRLQYKSKKTSTVFSVRWIPMGGFCNIKDLDEHNVSDIISIPKQLVVYIGGVLFNIIASFLVLVCLMSVISPVGMTIGREKLDADQLYILTDELAPTVQKADDGSLIVNDINDMSYFRGFNLVSVSGQKSYSDIKSQLEKVNTSSQPEYITLQLEDSYTYEPITINLLQKTDSSEVYGFSLYDKSLLSVITDSASYFKNLVGMQVDAFKILANRVSGDSMQLELSIIDEEEAEDIQLQSVIGFVNDVGRLSAEMPNSKSMIITFMSSFISIGIALAFCNLLPLPILDGGRILIALIEAIIRNNISLRVKNIIIYGSFIFIMLFSVVFMAKDVLSIWHI